MPSSFTWLDHSEAQPRRMQEVIDRFAEKETRDELGLGGIRDSFADPLFPGTSVRQRRAAYLSFVPRMYRHLEEAGIRSDKIDRKRRQVERCIDLKCVRPHCCNAVK